MIRAFIVVGTLLMWTAVASGECAWVLWTKEENATGSSGWSMGQALASRADCLTSLQKMAAGFKEVVILGDIRAGSFTAVEKASSWTYFGKCVPDTLDPRGPKGAR